MEPLCSRTRIPAGFPMDHEQVGNRSESPCFSQGVGRPSLKSHGPCRGSSPTSIEARVPRWGEPLLFDTPDTGQKNRACREAMAAVGVSTLLRQIPTRPVDELVRWRAFGGEEHSPGRCRYRKISRLHTVPLTSRRPFPTDRESSPPEFPFTTLTTRGPKRFGWRPGIHRWGSKYFARCDHYYAS